MYLIANWDYINENEHFSTLIIDTHWTVMLAHTI